jgi:hypothetical protein
VHISPLRNLFLILGLFSDPTETVGGLFDKGSSPVRNTGLHLSPPRLGPLDTTHGGGRGRGRLEAFGSSKRQVNRGPQCAKERTNSEHLVFDEDIDMDRVVEFSELAVVGRARGKWLSSPFLRSWMESSWGSNLSVLPSIRLLARGWFAFVFSATSDVSWVLSKTWSMVGTPIVLKRWTPSFDAKRERVDVVPVWVRLSGPPHAVLEPRSFLGNRELSGGIFGCRLFFRRDRQYVHG